MSIDRLPSGTYRFRKTVDGVNYKCTFDHEPTKKEITKALADMMKEHTQNAEVVKLDKKSFNACAEEYIQIRKNVISESTVVGYKSTLKNLSEEFKALNIYSITNNDIQKEINEYSKTRSAKTVRNANGFISAVLGTFRPSLSISTTLPQKVKKEPYIPSEDDVKKVIDYVKGTNYEIWFQLAALGLRRSEILALEDSDLEGNILTINKALVKNDDGVYVIKSTKTTESTRQIYLPDNLVSLIKEKGIKCTVNPNRLYARLQEVQDKLGLEHFSLHKMRHYFASKMSTMTDDATVMALGGWSTDYVMKTVYRHSLDAKNIEKQKNLMEKFF